MQPSLLVGLLRAVVLNSGLSLIHCEISFSGLRLELKKNEIEQNSRMHKGTYVSLQI
jgi:hypothetical protein